MHLATLLMTIIDRHYRGHCEQELEKLDRLRVKRRRDEREEEEGGLRGGRGRVVEVLRERRERRRERRLRDTEGEGGGGECPHCRDQVSWQQFFILDRRLSVMVRDACATNPWILN